MKRGELRVSRSAANRFTELYCIKGKTRANRKDDCNQTVDQNNYFCNLITNTGLKIRISFFHANINIQCTLQVDASRRRAPTCIPYSNPAYTVGIGLQDVRLSVFWLNYKNSVTFLYFTLASASAQLALNTVANVLLMGNR